MNPVRNSQQADLPVLQNGLSDSATSVSLASTLPSVYRAGTRVRRNATGILSGLPNDDSFSYWQAPIFFPPRGVLGRGIPIRAIRRTLAPAKRCREIDRPCPW